MAELKQCIDESAHPEHECPGFIGRAGVATTNAELMVERKQAAIAFHRRRLATLDNLIEQGEVSRLKGLRRAAEALTGERDHLAVLLEAADRREAPDV